MEQGRHLEVLNFCRDVLRKGLIGDCGIVLDWVGRNWAGSFCMGASWKMVSKKSREKEDYRYKLKCLED